MILPVVSGGLAVTAIFAFLSSWNEFLFALLLTSVKAQTTPIVIANFQSQFGLDWGPMTALATVYSLPEPRRRQGLSAPGRRPAHLR